MWAPAPWRWPAADDRGPTRLRRRRLLGDDPAEAGEVGPPDARVAHHVSRVGGVDHRLVADIDAHVVGVTAEEDEVARSQLLEGDGNRPRLLVGGHTREAGPGCPPRPQGQAGAVEGV